MLFYLGLAALVNVPPKLAWALHLAMIAAAGFVIDVVPVMDSASGFAVRVLFNKPAKWTRKQASETCSPAIRQLPFKTRVENHAASQTDFIHIIPQLKKLEKP